MTKSAIAGSVSPAADNDWQGLLKLMAPSKAMPVQGRHGVEPTDIGDTGRLHKAMLQAKAFYTKYPTDARAAAARKHEALAAIQAVQLGALQYQPTAMQLGSAFRGDTRNNQPDDRLEVAIAMETLSLASALNGKTLDAAPAVQEAMIDRLNSEIGDTSRIYGMYLGLMRNSDPDTAKRVATKVAQKNAPTWAKAQAQDTIDRAALAGKSLVVPLTTVSGKSLSLSATGSQATVMYFWSKSSRGEDLAALESVKASIPAGSKWIYEGLGETSLSEGNVAASVPFPGDYCIEPLGFNGPVAQSFKVKQTPWVCVLDRSGKVAGSGRVADLPALLSAVR